MIHSFSNVQNFLKILDWGACLGIQAKVGTFYLFIANLLFNFHLWKELSFRSRFQVYSPTQIHGLLQASSDIQSLSNYRFASRRRNGGEALAYVNNSGKGETVLTFETQ